MQEITEMAEKLGQALARTEEYQALKQAIDAAGEDRELVELQNKIQDLEQTMQTRLKSGDEPTEEQKKEYEEHFTKLQGNSAYQRLVAAQSNFDKVVGRVNQTIHEGIQKGADSRIILS